VLSLDVIIRCLRRIIRCFCSAVSSGLRLFPCAKSRAADALTLLSSTGYFAIASHSLDAFSNTTESSIGSDLAEHVGRLSPSAGVRRGSLSLPAFPAVRQFSRLFTSETWGGRAPEYNKCSSSTLESLGMGTGFLDRPRLGGNRSTRI
jgi:hypothetical protein